MSEKEKYAAYLCSPEWWAKRNAVMERANFECEQCGREAKHVHHLTYIRKYHERLEDLKALCERCHDAIHKASYAKSQATLTEKHLVRSLARPAFGFESLNGMERELFEIFAEDDTMIPIAAKELSGDELFCSLAKTLFLIYTQNYPTMQGVDFDAHLDASGQSLRRISDSIKHTIDRRKGFCAPSVTERFLSLMRRFEQIRLRKEKEEIINELRSSSSKEAAESLLTRAVSLARRSQFPMLAGFLVGRFY